MFYKSILSVMCTCLILLSFNANAQLLSRLGGLAYYDDVTDLTWLTDNNAGAGSVFDNGASTTDGLMTWQNATDWAASLEVAGTTGWRLASSGGCYGSGCNGSEMYDFITELENSIGLSNSAHGIYWLADVGFFDPVNSHTIFITGDKNQLQSVDDSEFYAWAVQTGDVSAVPVPAAVWLFGSGLLGLVGVAKRRKI